MLMDNSIKSPVKLECPQCGSDNLVAEAGGEEPDDDEMINCGSCGVQVGVWRAVRQQAVESSSERP
jgi:transcription elongation factor Elf1